MTEWTEQTRQTCREALRARRAELIDLTGYDILDDDSKLAVAEQVAAIDAAHAALDAPPQPQPVALDAPDGPGWWAFEGSEWGSEPIWPDDYDPDDDDDDDRAEWISPIDYRDVKGEPFRTPLLVRYSTPGETVSFRDSHGRYNGEPILGYLNTHHSWDHCLHSLDHLVGKWYRLYMPWEQPQPPIPADVHATFIDCLGEVRERLLREHAHDTGYAVPAIDAAFAWLDAHSPQP